MSTREIVTLQFGHYSNFVGSHFWNIQEHSFDYTGTNKNECNHDILYREGQNSSHQTTYTPRLLISDLKGALGTLPETGGLPDSFPIENLDWNNFETIEEEPAHKNEYLKDLDENPTSTVQQKEYNFETDVQTWTDYLYARFHPRTINIVRDYQHQNSVLPFDTYSAGQNIWKSDYGETFSDNIRKYVEECDSIQGFQVNFDTSDGFSGLALGCIQHLTDEYSKTILAHPIIASSYTDNNTQNQDERDKSTMKDSMRLANLAIAMEGLSEHSTLFVPLCTGDRGWRKPGNPRLFEGVTYNPELYYHSAAILASAMDTLSLKYRHVDNTFSLSDICADMTGYGRKMAAASLGLPFLMKQEHYLIDHLNNITKPIYTSITPSCKIGTDKIFQLITLRGIPEGVLKLPPNQAKEQKNLAAYRCNSIKEMLELYFQSTNFMSATNITVAQKPLKLTTPYPQFFTNKLDRYGALFDNDSEDKAESIPVIAGFHNGNFISDTLEKLHREVSRVKFSKLHMFKEDGFEESEFKEVLDRIAEFKDNYDDDFNL